MCVVSCVLYVLCVVCYVAYCAVVVQVHDDELVRIEDLGSNFYLDDSDVGKPRGQASSKELADINPNTYFSVHTGEVSTPFSFSHTYILHDQKAPSKTTN